MAIAVGAAALVAVGVGIALASRRPGTPPPPSCPAEDVADLPNGACPAGYTPDPSATGCCMPATRPNENLLLAANGETSALSEPSGTAVAVTVGGGVAGNPLVIAVGPAATGPFSSAH
ncbi:MAG: hypothetical protein ACREB9_00725, partial [Thermoplasmata archaeon]